ncbi:MAG: hypothetical protein WAM60_06170 [Candidatus Promineifilaceae bacterium]
MAKYIFSQGHVFVDEKAFSPTPKKSEQKIRLSVLLFTRGQRLTHNLQKENLNVQKRNPT